MDTLKSNEHFDELIEKDEVIMLFTADWCPDCRVIEPILPEIEKKYPEYKFIAVDRDDFIDICQRYDVFGIPSFVAFRNGREVGRLVSKNRKTKKEIEAFIDELTQA